jgi:DNA helicase-2/ATP-dependent DNA helicase PcrA
LLALTFTEKAAEEMLRRIDEAMPLGYEEPWLLTFHAFCERILRENAVEIGLDPSYEILTPPEAWIFVNDRLLEFNLKYFRPLGNPTKFIRGMLTLFSRAQDQDVSPEEYLKWAKGEEKKAKGKEEKEEVEKQQELARAYQKYQDMKAAQSKLDFGDLIIWTLRLFRERPSILKHYRSQFKEVLVDEFQDTNYAQYELLRLLAPPQKKPNLVVVADDDQCIYKWRGACISNVWQFKEDYRDSSTVVLGRTFRLHKGVFQPVYQLIQNNDPDRLESKLSLSKDLKTKGEGSRPEVLLAETADEEAEQVVEKIEELVESGEYTFSDIAILARANSHLDPFVAALRRHGVPYQLVGNRGLFEQEEVKELLAALRVLRDPHDRLSWYQLLSMDVWGIPAEQVFYLLSESQKRSAPLWEVLAATDVAPVQLIKKLQALALKRAPLTVLLSFVEKAEYSQRLLKEESLANQLKVKNINLFLERVKLYETKASSPNIPDLVDWLDSLIEAGESPAQAEIEDIDTVNLLTVHAAKGLEFPAVFLVSLTSDRFPTRNRRDPLELPLSLFKEVLPADGAHLKEERRLFFVGCTRAEEKLFLSLARSYGGLREKRPSSFLKELGIEITELPVVDRKTPLWQVKESTKDTQESRADFKIPHFSYSYFEDFKNCPLKFKFHYLLKIPVPPARAQSFGMAVHRVLRDFHRLPKRKRTLENLLDLYERHWIPLGYGGVEDQQLAKREGRKALRTYFRKHERQLGEPVFLEKGFVLKVDDVLLKGFIDRVDKTEKGYEIVDYKTADKVPDQKKVDRDEQLTIYALAAKEALQIEPTSLALYFIKQGEKVTTKRTPAQLEEEKKEIVKKARAIRESSFPAKPGILCHYCDFRNICPAFKLAPPLR